MKNCWIILIDNA